MVTNALLVRWTDGYIEVTDADSIAAHDRREGFLSLGNAPSVDEATRSAEATLEQLAEPEENITAGIEPAGTDDRPYTGFYVGDTITVPDHTGAPVSRRVASITVGEDEEGVPVFVPELRPTPGS